MHGHMNVKFITMHSHMNVKFITMHGHMNVKFITMHGHMNIKFITMHGHMNVKLILKCFKIRYEGTDWINLAEDTKKSLTVAKSRMLLNAVNLCSSLCQWLLCTPSACLPPVRTAQHYCVQLGVYLELVTLWGSSEARGTDTRTRLRLARQSDPDLLYHTERWHTVKRNVLTSRTARAPTWPYKSPKFLLCRPSVPPRTYSNRTFRHFL